MKIYTKIIAQLFILSCTTNVILPTELTSRQDSNWRNYEKCLKLIRENNYQELQTFCSTIQLPSYLVKTEGSVEKYFPHPLVLLSDKEQFEKKFFPIVYNEVNQLTMVQIFLQNNPTEEIKKYLLPICLAHAQRNKCYNMVLEFLEKDVSPLSPLVEEIVMRYGSNTNEVNISSFIAIACRDFIEERIQIETKRVILKVFRIILEKKLLTNSDEKYLEDILAKKVAISISEIKSNL